MSTNTAANDRPPLVPGVVSGMVAWIFGYALAYLLVASDVQDSPIQQFLEVIDGEPATYEMVGWVFYNAHFVDTVYTGVPLVGEFTTNAVGGDDGFSVILYVIPAALLFTAGLAVARYSGSDVPSDGAVAGLTVLPGYLLLSVLGLFLFEVSLGGATARPDLFETVVLAGLVYPAIFAAAGGVTASVSS